MLNFYQHIPGMIDPIAFSIGSFDIRWYSLAYLIGFMVVYLLLNYRAKRDNILIKISNFKLENSKFLPRWLASLRSGQAGKIQNLIVDFLIYSFLGLIVGARLGYILFYDLGYFMENPLATISPFSTSGNFVGIFGMSYHGGLIGIMIASLIFVKRNNIKFFEWADFVIPAIPAGYFFGRIGNFLNGELYGKATSHFWGMYFPSDSLGILRHPSQLYEAFFEGIVLFLILWTLRNSPPATFNSYPKRFINKVRKVMGGKSKFPGYLLCIYLIGYGIVRFFIEFLREPGQNLVSGLTTGQILSIIMFFFALLLFFKLKNSRFKEATS